MGKTKKRLFFYQLRKLWVSIGLILFALIQFEAFAQSPKNPFQQIAAIYVSEQGVHRFNLNQLQLNHLNPVWSVLSAVQTFEPVVSGGRVYVGTTQGLYALDASSGSVVWHIEEDKTIFSPKIFQNHLYAGSQHGQLYDISALDGRIHWRSQFDGWVYSPVVNTELGQLWTGGQGQMAIVVSMHDGKKLHQQVLEQEVVFSPVKVSNNRVAYNLFNGSTVIMNDQTLSVDLVIPGQTQARHLVVAGEEIYRSSRNGTLTMFNVSQTNKLNDTDVWNKKMMDAGLSLYATRFPFMILSDDDQQLKIFDTQQKKVVWEKILKGNWFAPVFVSPNKLVVFIRNTMNFNPLKALILHIDNKKEANDD